MTTRILNSRIDGLMSFPTDSRIARRLSNQQPTEKRIEGLTHWSTHDSRQNSPQTSPQLTDCLIPPLDCQVLSLFRLCCGLHGCHLPSNNHAGPHLAWATLHSTQIIPTRGFIDPLLDFRPSLCSCIFLLIYSQIYILAHGPLPIQQLTYKITSSFMAHSLFSRLHTKLHTPVITESGFNRSGYYRCYHQSQLSDCLENQSLEHLV